MNDSTKTSKYAFRPADILDAEFFLRAFFEGLDQEPLFPAAREGRDFSGLGRG